MSFYKNIFSNRKQVGGSKGAKPSFLMPPDGAFSKIGYQLYQALDLICEGPVAGLTDQQGLLLEGDSALKEFNSELNVLGSSVNGIDKGVYFNNQPLRNSANSATLGKYDVSFRSGLEFQEAPDVLATPKKLTNINTTIRGRYSLGSKDFDIELTSLDKPRNPELAEFETNSSKGTIRNRYRRNRGGRGTRFSVLSSNSALAAIAEKTKRSKDFDVTVTLVTADRSLLSANTSGLTARLTAAGTIFAEAYSVQSITDLGSDVEIVLTGRFKYQEDMELDISYSGANAGRLELYSATAHDGARKGTGSVDIRFEGTSARDFVGWQNFVPKEQAPRPYIYENYDENIKSVILGVQVDSLYDTKSYATAGENDAGRSKMGSQLPLTVTLRVVTGKAAFDGSITEQTATFQTRAANGVTVNDSNGTVSVHGIITAPYAISLENIQLPELSDTDLYNFVRLEKVEYETISNLIKRDVGIATLIEVCNETFLYPNSCTVGTSIDSRYYREVPERTFRLKGKKVLIPSNYNPINADGSDRRFSDDGSTRGNTIYDGPWDGTFKFDWTDNPAWIYYDLLINTRYGLGANLRDVNIVDKWSLYEIGMYCDAVTLNDGSATTNASGAGVFLGVDDGFGGLEPRFSCNLLIKDQAEAMEAMQDIAKSFRAMTYYNNSTLSVKVDRPYFFEDVNRTRAYNDNLFGTSGGEEFDSPSRLKFPSHLMFNNSRVKGGTFNYADVDRSTKLSAVEVSYLDKRYNYTQKTQYVEDAEAIKKVGLSLKQIEGIGVTSRAQAQRLAKYILFESLNTTETVSFNAGFEALLLEPGDIIRVDDEMKGFSKNFGTVLGFSGEVTYYEPDHDFFLFTAESIKGPKSILAQPAFNSDQLSLINEGVINMANPGGSSGISDLGSDTSNEDYRSIHQPQMISLKLVEGGSGLTYDVVDEGVLFHIDAKATFLNGGGDTVEPSQWFTKYGVNLLPGSSYTVDISGRDPKYYRVIGIEEDVEQGFNVSASIHHTGKFEFVENNVPFDFDADSFQPDLLVTEAAKPSTPINLATGSYVPNPDGTLNLYLTIEHALVSPGERFVIFLEEPNGNLVTAEYDLANDTETTVLLSGQAQIDQIGSYEINVFSENVFPSLTRSDSPITTGFTTTPSDFSFNTASDSFIEYADISLDTEFNTNYDNAAETGLGQNSFNSRDTGINAVINMKFEDPFGQTDNSVFQSVSGQIVKLRNRNGDLIDENFRVLSNESSITILNSELNSGFDYTGDNRYLVPPGLKFQGSSFELTGSEQQFIEFESPSGFYSEPPMVFTQRIESTLPFDSNGIVFRSKPLGRVDITTSGFIVSGFASGEKYAYFASPTGVFVFDNGTKKIEVGSMLANASPTTLQTTFAGVPQYYAQLQRPQVGLESIFSTTNITFATSSSFSFGLFDQTSTQFAGTGLVGYIATDVTGFNILSASELPFNTLNIASSGGSILEGSPIMPTYNGGAFRYENDQQIVLPVEVDNFANRDFYTVHRSGAENIVSRNPLITGEFLSGIRATSSSSEINATYANAAVNFPFLNNFIGNAYEISETGNWAAGDTRFRYVNTIGGQGFASVEFATPIASSETVDVSINVISKTGNFAAALITSSNTFASSTYTLANGSNDFQLTTTATAAGLYIRGLSNCSISGDGVSVSQDAFPLFTGAMSVHTLLRANQGEADGHYLYENMNDAGTSGFAVFVSGGGHLYARVNTTDYKLTIARIDDGENHLCEAFFNRHSTYSDDFIYGYVDGALTNAFTQSATTTDHFYDNVRILSNEIGIAAPMSGGLIVDGLWLQTGTGAQPVWNSDYLETGISSILDSVSGSGSIEMMVDFRGYPTISDLADRYTVSKIGDFEKSDYIVNRKKTSNINFIQIGDINYDNV